jgi:hypothetical protein
VLLLTGVVHVDAAAVEIGAVESQLGRVTFLGRAHFYESEPFRAAGLAVGDDVHRHDFSVGAKGLLESLFGGAVGKVTDVQPSRAHSLLHSNE